MGGWGWPNAYVCLQGGWVGVAKCLRNYKKNPEKDQIDLEEKLHGFAIFESQINTNTTDD